MSRPLRALLVGAPAFAIGLLGLAHPTFLTPTTADRWRLVHVLLLPLFPLLGGALLYLLRQARGPIAWVARVLAFGYAVLYGALDSIAGIGAPAQVQARGRGAPIGDLFAAGDQLGHLGVLGLVLSVLLTGALLWRRHGSALALAGAVVSALCSYGLYKHHIFPPLGVLSLLGIGAGLVLMGWVEQGVAAHRHEDLPVSAGRAAA